MDPYEWYVLLDRATKSINYIPNDGKNLWICVSGSVLSNFEMIFGLKRRKKWDLPSVFDEHLLKSHNWNAMFELEC